MACAGKLTHEMGTINGSLMYKFRGCLQFQWVTHTNDRNCRIIISEGIDQKIKKTLNIVTKMCNCNHYIICSDYEADTILHTAYNSCNYTFCAKIVCIIGRAKRTPHWGVQSRFRVIYVIVIPWL